MKSIFGVVTLFALGIASAHGQVTLTNTATPASGLPGVTNIILTGSGFPAGTIVATNIDVKLEPAAGGPAVIAKATTIATVVGSTRRITFVIPAALTVSSPTSYLVSISNAPSTSPAFASSNKAQLTINPAARLVSVNPASGQQGLTVPVVLTGQFTNFVQGATQASFGAGISIGGAAEGGFGPVTVASATTATAQVKMNPAAALGARTVSVRTGIQQMTLANSFTVTSAPPPEITDFSPKTSPAGNLVTIAGKNFTPNPEVLLAKQGGGTISAPVGDVSATALSFTIPPGAATGPISVAVAGKTASSTAPLTINSSKTFTIAALPGAADLVRGQQVSFAVKLASGNGFSSLAALAVSGVPAGVTTSFEPAQITADQTSILTLIAPATQALGAAQISISAAATVEGIPLSQTAAATINVIAPTTSFVGRTVVDDALQTPLADVTVTMLGKDGSGGTTNCTGTTVSDAAGNFALRNLPASCVGRQLVGYDGLTVTSPAGKYAGVNLVYTLTGGQVTASPVLVHLPRIDDKETFSVKQNHTEDQSYAWKSIPGLSVVVYKTTFSLPNGSKPDPFPLVAVQVPVDRLPDSKPFVPTMMLSFIVAFQPANSKASSPAAVYYPNTLKSAPGANMPLMTLDPTRGQMVPYGTGTVATDGSNVIPDLDPSRPGRRYGITDFDWHGQMSNNPDPAQNPPTTNDGGGECEKDCESATSGDPVDLASGLSIYNVVDLAIRGNRGSVAVERIYRTLSTIDGPFGIGGRHNFNYTLDRSVPAGTVFTGDAGPPLVLVNPDNSREFFRKQIAGPNAGKFTQRTRSSLRAVVITDLTAGKYELRYPDGTTWTFSPDGPFLAHLTEMRDTNGNITTITRDTADLRRVTALSDPVGRSINFTYSGNHVTQLTEPIGRKVSYTYNGDNTLATVTDPEGNVTRYEYATPTQLARVIDKRGNTASENTFDSSSGRVTVQKMADGGTFRYDYQFVNPLVPTTTPVLTTIETDPLGHLTRYRFDPNGRLQSVQEQHERTGQISAAVFGPRGPSRLFTRDASNNNLVTSITGNGHCAVCASPEGGDMSFEYDANGNRTSAANSLGNKTTFTYDAIFNKVTSVTDPIGNRSEMSYDAKGNPTSSKDANGNVTTYAYNAFGQVIEVTNALSQKTKFEHDAFGNLVAVVDPLGNKTQLRYDAVSRLVESIDPLGRKIQTIYDKLDRVIKRIDGRGVATEFAYDPMDNLLTLTDGRGKKTTFTYDKRDRLITRTDPLGKSDTRAYDFNGNLTSFIDRRGQTSTFKYDHLDRLIEETYQDAVVTRFYDAAGRLVSIEDSQSGVFTMTYDAAGRLLSSSGPTGTINYQRDALGRVTSRAVVGGGHRDVCLRCRRESEECLDARCVGELQP